MEFTVILHSADEGGYWVEVPALSGCYSQGESVEDALCNVKEAMEAHIMALKADGQNIPKDRTLVFSHIEPTI